MNYTIGIDLTPPPAATNCGMVILLSRLLRYIPKNCEVKIILFVNKFSVQRYKRFCRDGIEYTFESPEIYHESVQRLDVLHSPFNEIFNYVDGVESILTKCDLIPCLFPSLFSKEHSDRAIDQCKNADHILTISDYSKYIILSRTDKNESNISVLYCPLPDDLDTESLNCTSPASEYILYPAAGRPHKNHISLFKAMPWIDKRLVLTTGETHDPQRFDDLAGLAHREGIADRVELRGHVSEEELKHLYHNAAALVYPSRSEGFGYPLIEAMSHGAPIACSFTSSIPEVVGDAGVYFDPLNPEDIACKVNTVLGEARVRAELTRNSKRVLRKYEGQTIGARLLELYKDRSHIARLNAIRARRNYQIKLRPTNRNILAEMKDIPALGLSDDLCVLMNCTRLFDGNPNSGIARYMHCLIRELLKKPNVALVPFFDSKARGYKGSKTDYETKSIRIGGKFMDVYNEDKARRRALCLSRKLVFHSPFHPLPRERDERFAYCLTVFDILHLTRPDIYPEGSKSITKDIVECIQPDDEVITISNFTAQELTRFRGERLNVTVAYLSTFMDSGEHTIADSRAFGARNCIAVPFQGDPRKNFDLMLDVVDYYREHVDGSVEICIFGRLRRLSEDQRQRLERSPHVTMLDEPDDSVMCTLFQRSICLLYLSTEEGFGLLPLEAMSAGCAPVMSKTKSLSEVYGDWPFLVDHTDAKGIANTIATLRTSDAENIYLKMRSFVSEYTTKSLCDDHMAAYCEALRRKL